MMAGAPGNILQVTRIVQYRDICALLLKNALFLQKKYSNRTVLVVATTLCTYGMSILYQVLHVKLWWM